ncbi:tol-pal system YbgF family protein [Acidobacteriota bacterium]
MKIKKCIICCFLIILIPALLMARTDREIFDKAKMDLFDKKWQPALKGLDTIISDFPGSNFYTLAYFYKGKCLEELERYKDALKCYRTFLDLSDNAELKEEAASAITNQYFALYEKGEKKYLDEIKKFLNSRDWQVRTFAAFKLSYVKDKKAAALAVPVLKKIVSREDDVELVDRAKIALMRIDPNYLKNLSGAKKVEASTLHIQIYDKKSKKDSLSLNIPFALARLALGAIPEKEKKALKRKGYDLDGIVKALIESDDIIKIESEESLLRIWID